MKIACDKCLCVEDSVVVKNKWLPVCVGSSDFWLCPSCGNGAWNAVDHTRLQFANLDLLIDMPHGFDKADYDEAREIIKQHFDKKAREIIEIMEGL